MAALLVAIAVMGILMSAAMPAWRHAAQREKEAELVFRGEQYAHAIGLYQRKYAGGFPPSIDLLVQQKFLRKKYKDPMTPDGEFRLLYQGAAATVETAPRPGMQGTARVQDPSKSAFSTGSTIGAGGPGMQGTAPKPGMQGTAGVQDPPKSAFSTGSTIGAGGPILGVTSKSTAQSIRLYRGRSRYNEWQFVYTAPNLQGGTGGGIGPDGKPLPGAAGGTRVPGQRTPGLPGSGPQRPGGIGTPGGPGRGQPGSIFQPGMGAPGTSPFPSPTQPRRPPGQ